LNIQLEPQWINKLFLAPNAASARVAADHLSLSESFSVLKNYESSIWGPSVRALLAQLAAESNEESMEGVYRPEGLHFGQVVNPNPPLTNPIFLQKHVQLIQHYGPVYFL